MYLKALEIQGFKSFPDKTVLTFGEDITAIVGPNGSGKSNISDAIRWVMGEQSTRALRGGKMEDVIFGGTAKRKQLGYAEVSLVLDNTEHFFDLEESEVMVTRRYYRSGESEYYINRRSVRLKDVNELFMDTGLGREGYSIIGQGKIDEILSVKSGDRREVFEEAAGISRYRHRKEDAERKLGRTDENLTRIHDKIEELELQVEPLRAQSEKAKKFLILRDEQRGLEISLWLEQLEKLRSGNIRLLNEYEGAVRRKDATQNEVDRLYAEAEELDARMREKDVEAETIRFRRQQREADANERENAIAVLKTHIQNNLENAQRIREELEQQAGRAGSIAGQMEDKKNRLAEIETERKKIEERKGEKDEELTQIGRSAGDLAVELEALRRKEALESASAGEAKALLSALAAASQELLDRDERLRQEQAADLERLDAAEAEAKATRKEYNEAVEERDSVKNMISGYLMRMEGRSKKAKEAEEQHMKLKMEENSLQSRIHMLSEMEKLYEGYTKAVKLVMGEAQRGNLKGIHGPVAGLLHVPDRYAVAIEIALGGAMQHVVVDREEDGKNAIRWLKQRDGGRATFLPMSAIRPSEFRDTGVEKEEGFVGMADRLISFEKAYEKIFSNLLGRTVIAENMDKAIAMARKFGHRFKIVTLDGQVLNPGGSMTGGSVSRSAGILSRANELERTRQQMDEIREKLAAAARTMEESNRELTAARYELETARSQQREYEDAVLKLAERKTHCDSVVADLRRRREQQEEELEQTGARVEQIEREIAAARKRIEELEGSAAALRTEAEGRQQGQGELQEKLEAVGQSIAALQAELAALEAERAAVEHSLAELETLKAELSGDNVHRKALAEEFERKNQDIQAQILEKESELMAIRARSQSETAELRMLNQEKLSLEGRRNQANKDSRDKNNLLMDLTREVSALEQKKAAAVMEEKQLLDKLWETYELTHEAAQAQRQELESTQKAARRVAELKRAISALGNINIDAIEQFEQVNERYTYLTEQRDDVTRAKKELEGIIAEITGEMKAIFAQQFDILNKAFGETFLELFGGGKATLELEDPEDILNCGIEIKVQPPGKALKIITLLSGGEKAFVAIALYFAILKVRPTPFVVMDEIEAALDDANVVRFARYMRRMSEKTQFIVITHRRGTMEEADVLYGVTMQEQGVSRMLTINLNDVEKELNIK